MSTLSVHPTQCNIPQGQQSLFRPGREDVLYLDDETSPGVYLVEGCLQTFEEEFEPPFWQGQDNDDMTPSQDFPGTVSNEKQELLREDSEFRCTTMLLDSVQLSQEPALAATVVAEGNANPVQNTIAAKKSSKPKAANKMPTQRTLTKPKETIKKSPKMTFKSEPAIKTPVEKATKARKSSKKCPVNASKPKTAVRVHQRRPRNHQGDYGFSFQKHVNEGIANGTYKLSESPVDKPGFGRFKAIPYVLYSGLAKGYFGDSEDMKEKIHWVAYNLAKPSDVAPVDHMNHICFRKNKHGVMKQFDNDRKSFIRTVVYQGVVPRGWKNKTEEAQDDVRQKREIRNPAKLWEGTEEKEFDYPMEWLTR